MSKAEQIAGPHAVREVKQKFRVHGLFRLPDLSALPGIDVIIDQGVVEFESTYFDARDLRLAREGITLRRRTGTDEGWHLKLPVAPDRPGARDEFRLPLTDTGDAPAALTTMVRIILRDAPLELVATLRTTRSRQLIRVPAGDLAALVDDAVHVLDTSGNIEARFRELELEEFTGGPVFDEVLAALNNAGAVGGEFMAKAVRALGPRAAAPPEVPAPADPRPKDPAHDTLHAYLAEQVRALRAADLTFRRDPTDPEAVHQLRVAARRLRSGLRTFRPLLKREWATSLGTELAWFGRSLGTLREAGVQLERLSRHAEDLAVDRSGDLPVDAVRAVVSDVLGAVVTKARARVVGVLNSDRYVALHSALVAAVQRPRTTPMAEHPAADVLPSLVEDAWRRLAKTCSTLTDADPDDRWHGARLRAKRTRYAAEAVSGTLGKDAKTFAKQMEKLTEILGEHQDAAQAAAAAHALATSRQVSPDVARALDLLATQERGNVKAARKKFTPAWREAQKKSLQRWFDS